MKKILLISAIAATGLFADAMVDMAKDAAISKVKTTAKTAVMEKVGDSAMAKTAVEKVVSAASSKDPVATLKSEAVSAVTGAAGTSAVPTSVEGAKTKATDMAVEKVVGSNPIQKAIAKEAIKSAI